MNKYSRLIFSGLPAGLSLIIAPQSGAFAQTLLQRSTVASNREAVLRAAARWNKNCRQRKITVSLETPPEHGYVCQRSAKVPLARGRTGKWDYCLVSPVDGIEIVYVSHPDYSGSDRVSYSLAYGSRQLRTYQVDVTVTNSPSDSPKAGRVQSAGPMPVCPELTS